MLNLKHSSEIFSSIISNQNLDHSKSVSDLLSTPLCKKDQRLRCGDQGNCVLEDVQAEKTNLNTCMIDQMHEDKDILSSKDHNVIDDLPKANECADKAESENHIHMDDSFGTGMKYAQHTEVSSLQDSMITFVNNMLREVFLSLHHFYFEHFSST